MQCAASSIHVMDQPARPTVASAPHAQVATRIGLASQYHSRDFDWEELRREVEPLVLKQQELGRTAAACRPLPLAARPKSNVILSTQQALSSLPAELSPASQDVLATASISTAVTTPELFLAEQQQQQQPTQEQEQECLCQLQHSEQQHQGSSWSGQPPPAHQTQTNPRHQRPTTTLDPPIQPSVQPSAAVPCPAHNEPEQCQHTAQPEHESGNQPGGHNLEAAERQGTAVASEGEESFYDGSKWDDFYASTARTARFFKERRYLLLEFPVLAVQGPQHVVELGCGYGASLLPILRHNPHATVTATDISPTCVAQLRDVAEREAISGHADRITSFVADSADSAALPLFAGLSADVALIMFTLSAVPPEGQAAMLSNAWASLKPGGLLCIRDHGLYDMVQLRIPPEQWMGPNMYRRGDGTLAYFFSTEDLSEKASAAGFEVQECEYVTVYNINRKTGLKLRRVFIHGVFKK